MNESTSPLMLLKRSFDPSRPLEDMDLYVKAEASPALDIALRLDCDPSSQDKYLLMGGRGGGKSTELRRIAQELAKNKHFILSMVDLDKSGITAPSLSAFDLVYLCSIALLRFVPDENAGELFDALRFAYAGSDEKKAGTLGTLKAALEGLAGFGKGVGVASGSPEVMAFAGAAKAGAFGISLFTNNKLVSESSPQGLLLQAACVAIVKAARRKHGGRSICIFLDGLEKMNGEANERFKGIFQSTRLLQRCPFSMVIAAPPSTLTSHDATHLDYKSRHVLGFTGPNKSAQLDTLITRRLDAQGLDADNTFPPAERALLIEACGGQPAHLMIMASEAVMLAMLGQRQIVLADDVAKAIHVLRVELHRGLDVESSKIVANVHETGMLPRKEGVASLFANGRILVEPPNEQGEYRYRAHPLLLPLLDATDAAESDP